VIILIGSNPEKNDELEIVKAAATATVAAAGFLAAGVAAPIAVPVAVVTGFLKWMNS